MELKLKFAIINNLISYLLIVPYGIETSLKDIAQSPAIPFNCTLWN